MIVPSPRIAGELVASDVFGTSMLNFDALISLQLLAPENPHRLGGLKMAVWI